MLCKKIKLINICLINLNLKEEKEKGLMHFSRVETLKLTSNFQIILLK